MSTRHPGDDRNNRDYVMLSPHGGRPHDHAPSPPSSMSPGMGCGRVLEWEVGLPTAEELTPLSHPLIPRALAAAFRIDVAGASASSTSYESPTSHLSLRGDEYDDEDGGDDEMGETTGSGEQGDAHGAKACRGGKVPKKRRMVWTPELHRRFVAAVAQLGDKAAVPKAIMEVMNVEGMTREHVASHLQKYRVYLKRTGTTNAAPPTSLMTPPTGADTTRSSSATATSGASATNKNCL